MSNRKVLLSSILSLIITIILQVVLLAQPPKSTSNVAKQGWDNSAKIGLDFLSNLMINPQVGSGESRLGFSTNIGINANLNSGRFEWYNSLNTAFSIQKLGRGYLKDHPDVKVPFQKNTDNFLIISKAALRTTHFSQYYYTGELSVNTQLLKTYQGNYLKDIENNGHPLSGFMSPGIIRFSIGIDYRHDNMLSIFFAPISYKFTIVKNDSVATISAYDKDRNFIGTVHGNDFYYQNDSLLFKNKKRRFGALLKVVYKNKFFQNRIEYNSSLRMFLSYKNQNAIPAHLKEGTNAGRFDFEWLNEVDVKIWKSLSLAIISNLIYDNNVFIQKTNKELPTGLEEEYSRTVSYFQQLLIRYKIDF